MATVEEGLRSQIQNIEATYGRPIDAWIDLIRPSGRTRHGEIVAMLKGDYGMTHGAANRVALIALNELTPKPDSSDPEVWLYTRDRRPLVPIHSRLMESINGLGPDIEIAPKKGYLSLRRRRQFAMIKPAAKHIDLGLVLPGRPVDARLESAATFNALFTHRVRVRSVDEVDRDLVGWLHDAYAGAS
jgi:predicted transport protein